MMQLERGKTPSGIRLFALPRIAEIIAGPAFMLARTLSILPLLVLSSLSGCSASVPPEGPPTTTQATSSESTKSESVRLREAFDRIIPGRTSTDDLHQLGLDPATSAHIKVLNGTGVARYFNVDRKHPEKQKKLDLGVRYCIHSGKYCRGYVIATDGTDASPEGRAAPDSGAKSRSPTTDPTRTAAILIKNDLVVYKRWSGESAGEQGVVVMTGATPTATSGTAAPVSRPRGGGDKSSRVTPGTDSPPPARSDANERSAPTAPAPASTPSRTGGEKRSQAAADSPASPSPRNQETARKGASTPAQAALFVGAGSQKGRQKAIMTPGAPRAPGAPVASATRAPEEEILDWK
ncbi:MAG: hypothetical protein HQL66_02960 [Magnetococcales bacterium]|nr:hypothetical protein [Magnetococcales bacterium]